MRNTGPLSAGYWEDPPSGELQDHDINIIHKGLAALRAAPTTCSKVVRSSGTTYWWYWLASVINTRSPHGCKEFGLVVRRGDMVDYHTRSSYSQSSLSFSSRLTHSSGSAIHFSRADGSRGINLVTRSLTASSTKACGRTVVYRQT